MDTLPLNQQENVLIALTFGEQAGIVAGLVDPSLFDNEVYRTVAARAIEYYAKYRKAPGAHIADLLERQLSTGSRQQRQAYRDCIAALYQAQRDGFNEEFIIEGLRAFVRQQRLKQGVLRAAEYLQAGQIEQAEQVIYEAVRARDESMRLGTTLRDYYEVLLKLEHANDDHIATFISALDELRVGPARKTLFLLMAATNRGKSWGLIHLGAAALRQRLRVVHVTLEMSEDQVLARYMQTLFALRKHKDKDKEVRYTTLETDRAGIYVGHKVSYRERPAILSRAGRKKIKKRLGTQQMARRFKLVIREFPTSTLTVPELRGYLDYLERYDNFIPDVLIIDYPDLMALNVQELRVDTGRLYKDLRGIATERNLALVTATQSNRAGEDATKLSLKHVSEDYSKMATADVVITYNQTEAEAQYGLARLFVAKARGERRGDTVLIAQSYEIGQFCTGSCLLRDPYKFLQQLRGEDE